jgi:ABC-type Fe3+ transport system permease subunit
MKPKWITLLLGGAAAFIAHPFALHACSVCITGASDPTTDAFNWSVLFLMATPYLVVGSIAAGLVLAYRRTMAKGKQMETPEQVVHFAWNEKETG